MSSHPPFRLRLSLALLVLVLAGVTVGAATLLGSGQEDPAEAETTDIVLAGPPLPGATPEATPNNIEGSSPGLRLGVLDKEQAIAEERDARADARALQALADQQAAIAEYAAAVAAAETAAAAPSGGDGGGSTPPPSNSGGGGGGGGGTVPPPPSGGSLYEKLDRIAMCESGQNTQAHNPDGPWWGAFQFHFDTWRAYGGGGDRGRDILGYSYAEQREVAANLARARGFSPWPHCSAQLGYT